jgi:hypothetical protein
VRIADKPALIESMLHHLVPGELAQRLSRADKVIE